MLNAMLPDLPESYYHDNVLTLFAHVENLYTDLLDAEMRYFFARFAAVHVDAQRLYIRLLNRSHDWFRLSKLTYAEIGSLERAIETLERYDLLRVDAAIDAESLLALFTKAELVAASEQPELKKLRRGDLVAQLLEQQDQSLFEHLFESDTLLRVQHRDRYQIAQMLFFGNLNQSMTDFVLRDLGLYQFESYPVDLEHRPYRSAEEIAQHWSLYQLEAALDDADLADTGLLKQFHAQIPVSIDPLAPAYRKGERLRYEIARQIERNGELERALELYRACRIHPARERIARILAQQDNPAEALACCARIIHAPIEDAEIQFAGQFADRLAKRHQLQPIPGLHRYRPTHRPETEYLELDYDASVEMAVANHYDAVAGEPCCHYVENTLFNGVLGLLFWDVIFAPLPGAFFNPFQFRPSDFYAPDFCERRQHLIDRVWSSIQSTDEIGQIVKYRWVQKHGLMNPLVHWSYLELELIEHALERIDFAHWRAIFERMLCDLRHNRAGFPDLLHLPAAGGYCLIEVKGPGDSLQKNQQRWMQYFSEHGIPHRLTRVTWKQD